MVLLPATSSNTVPLFAMGTSTSVVPKRLPCASTRLMFFPPGVGPVGVLEAGKGGEGSAAGGQLEDRALAVGPAFIVVPKRLPCASRTGAAAGPLPLAPLKETRVVRV